MWSPVRPIRHDESTIGRTAGEVRYFGIPIQYQSNTIRSFNRRNHTQLTPSLLFLFGSSTGRLAGERRFFFCDRICQLLHSLDCSCFGTVSIFRLCHRTIPTVIASATGFHLNGDLLRVGVGAKPEAKNGLSGRLDFPRPPTCPCRGSCSPFKRLSCSANRLPRLDRHRRRRPGLL
jgi:hypothetical protein